MIVNDVYSLLRLEEGEILFCYDDYDGNLIKKGSLVRGNPTIGVGRSLNIAGISRDESDELLTHDVQKWTQGLSQHSWFNSLDKVRQAALVDMAHALGLQGTLDFSDLIAGLVLQDWQQASDGVLASKWASEEPTRAKRVSLMLLNGQWPSI